MADVLKELSDLIAGEVESAVDAALIKAARSTAEICRAAEATTNKADALLARIEALEQVAKKLETKSAALFGTAACVAIKTVKLDSGQLAPTGPNANEVSVCVVINGYGHNAEPQRVDLVPGAYVALTFLIPVNKRDSETERA